MIEYVSSLGQNSFALTDHESVSGHVQFIKEVKKLKKEDKISKDFKPILGNEIYLLSSEEEMNKEIQSGEKVHFYHFLLLAKDAIGHKQLRQLSSRAWERMFTYKGLDRVPTFHSDIEEVIGEDKGHLIASSACLGSFFAQNVLSLISENCEDEMYYKYRIHDFVTWCIDVFGKDDFYIEIQPSKESQEQIEYNKKAIEIAKAYDLGFLVSTDSHYLKIEDRNIHKAYLTSDEEDGGDREVDAFYHSTHFFTGEMLEDYLDYLDEEDLRDAVQSTLEIANKIEEYDLAHKQIIPKIELPDKADWFYDGELYSKAKKYLNIKAMIESKEVFDKYLINLVLKGVNNKITKEDYKETFERIDTECKEILEISKNKDEPISSYFVTMEKNIDIIWEEAQSIIGTSRGSAAGFMINYLIGITQINPLKQDGITMPHWRFITGQKPVLPDIDIDVSSYKRDIVFQCLQNYYESIGGKVVRVCTFGTETAKSTILTAARGLKINNDIGLYLSSLIPISRGFVQSIEDTYYGNEEKDIPPVHEFKKMVDEHEGLLEVALGIQGLINKRSSHASGVLIVNEDFTEHNAIMRTPSKEIVSQFNLDDSEYVGNIKYDILQTKTCSMIQKALEMLVEHNKMEWQGTLRKTYDKYLHPDILDRTSPELWERLYTGELISPFQFEGSVGMQALKAIKPTNLLDATNSNNIMRLMVESGEQPLDMYVRYRNDISQWYQDMKDFGLKDEHIKVMERHLLNDYGVCSSQERLMLLAMDEEIAGLDVIETDILRKGVSKKIKEYYIKSEEKIYKKGMEKGIDKVLQQYVLDVQIAMQKSYGFSILHGVGYTYILIQQLNLIHHYPTIFWNTSVLLVESGALEQDTLDDDSEEDEEEVLQKHKEKTTNYGTVAKAIGNMQSQGVHIVLPDINIADLGFKPDEDNNQIIFGLKGIMRISNDASRIIMENRPYKSLNDFYERLVKTKREVTLSTGKKQNKSYVTDGQMILFVKAGAFDKLENESREQILLNYLMMTNPPKTNINAKSIQQIIELGFVPTEFENEIKFHNFRKYLLDNSKIQDENTKSIKWHCLSNGESQMNDYATNFFLEYFANEMTEDKDYHYDDDGIIYVAMGTNRQGSFDNIYKDKMNGFMKWLQSEECLNKYNNYLFDQIKNQIMDGGISRWEMESVNYYSHPHELLEANLDAYSVEDFNELPEEPIVTGFTEYKGLQYPKFELTRIAGTVLDKDKTRHTIALLTPTGVVQIKLYAGQFSYYDARHSVEREDGKGKTVIEDSWFSRGNRLLVTGFRRGDQFKPKRYKSSVFSHSVQKINGITPEGDLILQSERRRED